MTSLFSGLRLASSATPPSIPCVPQPMLQPQAERDRGKLTVILDMDETLLHSRFTSADNSFRQAEARQEITGDFDFSLVFNSGEGAERVYVNKRPGLAKFLRELSQEFEPVIFTAALSVYASPVLDRIDTHCHLRDRLYRESTVCFRGQNFVKDIALTGRDMKRVVLVDNNPLAMLATPDNAIPIPSWFDNPTDNELEKVLYVLREMKNLPDVRPYLKKKFKFRQLLSSMNVSI